MAVKVNTKKVKNHKPEEFIVNLWTNIYHKENNEGEWHAIQATYKKARQIKEDDYIVYLYGVEIVVTCLGRFNFTFNAKHKYDHVLQWAGHFEIDGLLRVKLPVKEYTTWIQEPKINQITHNIYIGNFNAAVECVDLGFDCLLNMADDAHVFPEQFTRPIIYKKCPLPFGADKPIRSEVIEKVVKWLRFMSFQCNRIMVCSRTGHARSGSILIAYIYFMNPDLNFEEAYAFVDSRCFVYPHKGLKATIVGLYPRS